MYARVARFEGMDPGSIDQRVAEMKRMLEAGRAGELPPEAPEGARTLMETVKRVTQLVDRESGTAIGIVLCETEDDLRRADAALNEMSPGEGGGRRAGVELYEVVVDEAF